MTSGLLESNAITEEPYSSTLEDAIPTMLWIFVARFPLRLCFSAVAICAALAVAANAADVTFSTAFEGGSVGRIEKLEETTFRVHVLGQQDERGSQSSGDLVLLSHRPCSRP